MSRVIKPWKLTYADGRIPPLKVPPAEHDQTPSIAPGGFDVASFQKAGQAVWNGAALWAEIHRRALAHDGSDDTQFIDSITQRLPCSLCRPHWLDLLKVEPPTFGSHYFAWTVWAHNEVNARLEKPLVTVEQARAIWGVEKKGDAPSGTP